jgi:hypothetical protein
MSSREVLDVSNLPLAYSIRKRFSACLTAHPEAIRPRVPAHAGVLGTLFPAG